MGLSFCNVLVFYVSRVLLLMLLMLFLVVVTVVVFVTGCCFSQKLTVVL